MRSRFSLKRGTGIVLLWATIVHAAAVPTRVWAELPELATDSPRVEQLALIKEYQENYSRLKDFYGNIEMVAIQRLVPEPTSGGDVIAATKPQVQFVYRSRQARFFRMDRTVLDSDDTANVGAEIVSLVRPEGHVIAERAGADCPFAVHDWDTSREGGLNEMTRHRFQSAAYSVCGAPAEYFLFQRNDYFKKWVVKFVAFEEAGERLAVATVERTLLAGGGDAGRFVFYRDRSWAIREAELGTVGSPGPASLSRRSRCEYKGERSGIPLLNRVEIWEESGAEKRKANLEIYDIEKTTVGPVAEREFTLDLKQA